MRIFHPQWLLLWACLALLAACDSPGYNDNPSQQISAAKLGCPAATEFFAVYFSVRVQPPSQDKEAKPFRCYCHDLPSPGLVFFTADLVGNELRKTPLALRVVEQEFTGLDASRAESFRDLRVVAELAPKIYANGLIEASFAADTKGYYAVYLIRGGEAAATEQDRLRIPLNIGVDPATRLMAVQLASLFGIVLLAAMAGRLRFGHRRKLG